MLDVIKAEVRSFDITYNDIIWEIRSTIEDVHNYTSVVIRSEAEFGPFDTISPELVDIYRFRDSSVPTKSMTRLLFYRIRITNTITSEVLETKSFRREGISDIISRSIMKNHNVYLSRLAGRRCWVFPIKTFGQYCPQCYDEVIGKAVRNNCQVCWGTGFAGGYHYPVQIWAVVKEPSELREGFREGMPKQNQMFSVELGASPTMKPTDILIDSNNRRMKVVSVTGPDRDGIKVVQTLMCVRFNVGSVEDKIPLRIPDDVTLLTTEGKINPYNIKDDGIDSIADLF